MSVTERILLTLSKDPSEIKNQRCNKEQWGISNALDILCLVFPDFLSEVSDKRILDFGCGTGYQSVALGLKRAAFVLGVEIDSEDLLKARQLASGLKVEDRVEFVSQLDGKYKNFDVVISQNSFEHFEDPEKILHMMGRVLGQNGKIFITFGPPWFSPYGSHMQYFTPIPWVNLLFPETTVMNVRKHFRDDGARRYEEVEGGLNRMSVAKFERIISDCGMKILYKRYECVKGLDLFADIPGVRELFINQVNCILVKK